MNDVSLVQGLDAPADLPDNELSVLLIKRLVWLLTDVIVEVA